MTDYGDADKELRKMVAFIMQEATEKCREIHVKADEEFNIEKAKLVHQETTAIQQQFERRVRQAEVRRKMYSLLGLGYFNIYVFCKKNSAQSNQLNKARLKVLQAQDEAIDEIMESIRVRLAQKITEKSSYKAIMTDLILQCLFRCMDDEGTSKEILLRVKRTDVDVAADAMRAAQLKFKEHTGYQISCQLDQDHHLDEGSIGGVLASSAGGRILLSNTLSTRLELASEALLPVIRAELFGPSQTRKFFD